VICIAIPIFTSRNTFIQAQTPSGLNRLLPEDKRENDSEFLGGERILATVSPHYATRQYSIYIFSAIWTGYEVIFLLILLFGNPGYGDPIIQKQLSI
jgi:hypothetical protein